MSTQYSSDGTAGPASLSGRSSLRSSAGPTGAAAPAPARDVQDGQDAQQEAELTGTAAFDAGVGDMPSWGELVAEHADSVYRLAYRLSGNQHDAEDLTQRRSCACFAP